MTTDLRQQLEHTLAGNYTLEGELRGGMSIVYIAEETRLGRKVVIKLLPPERAAGISAERFEREIRLAATLQHPNIVPLLTTGEIDGLPYFTMPYVEGQSLRTRLADGKPLPVAEAITILRDVARALGYAHEHGVVHRDIKPDNVLLSRGAAEVTDFGIAKALAASRALRAQDDDDTGLTQFGTSLGTPGYMSPEQAAGDPDVDERADIYALGCIAYEMLTGHPPFAGTQAQVMAAHISSAPAPIATPGVPPHVQNVVLKCLAKEPSQRYPSADELLADLDATTPATPTSLVNRRRGAILTIGVAVLGATLWFGSSGMRRARWVHTEAVPRIKELIERGQQDSAWLLARQVADAAPNDTVLTHLWPRFAVKAVFHSTPEGARLYRATYEDSSQWVYLGTTPTDSVLVSARVGLMRVEKPGFRTLFSLTGNRQFVLQPVGSSDSDMVAIAGGSYGAFLVGTERLPALKLGDYEMAMHEVTNRQYRAFVAAGGYSKRELWPAGAEIAKYVDKTGRPGPSTWEAGEFPAGQADVPVGGVSWYEAEAYAAFVHKSLPTIYHWAHAATVSQSRFVIPGSNFESNGAAKGGTFRGVSAYGVFDMAGNVREWCENSTGGEERYILGGGWTDPPYGFTDAYAQPASDRAPINGIRLVKYLTNDAALAKAKEPELRSYRDYAHEKPMPAADFETFRHEFDYDRTALNARVESRDSTVDDDFILERVSFDAAYGNNGNNGNGGSGNERMFANVYLPKHGTPPYQAIVAFPGSGVISVASSLHRNDSFAFIAKAGRIYVLPVLKSTFERRDSLHNDVGDASIYWRDHVVMWSKDIRRTLDYLSTRRDVDTTRFGFFGYSWGSNQAALNLAIEPRFKAAVLYVAGLTMEKTRPEVDPFNYLPYVKIPVAMLNGRYDFFFPVQISQKPFYENLGTRPADRMWKIYEGGHDVPRTELIAETLKWYDKYLGPVR